MRIVPRHHFVDSALATQAYEDTSLPIGLGQTISKPSVVARMLSILHEGVRARASGSLGRVLEIGTGCGYQTALLGQMAQRVLSVERLKPLHDKARANLGEHRPGHIRLVYGDGRLGHPPNAPYDSIIAAAGGSDLPAAWLEQLADGGRLVAPMEGRGGGQALLVVDRQGDEFRRSMHEAVHFVPLKSGIE
jgi:protein-L-isoaspartate(D-aspartate) O-methyltransferase